MSLTAKLALAQVKTQKQRSLMTILGIALSCAMLTTVIGLVLSVQETVKAIVDQSQYTPARMAMLDSLGYAFGAVIIAASVIVVSNAFRVSAGERKRQFGMLKSVGATKKQIAATVVYEGVFLSVIGIPLGILAGLTVEFTGISVANKTFSTLYENGAFNKYLHLPFMASPVMFIAAAALSFVTVMLSAWLPARKAAEISAINAIRGDGVVKIKNMKTLKIIEKIYGFEGALAAKSIRRNGRNNRATIISLTVSIIMIIMVNAFAVMMDSMIDLQFPHSGITAYAQISSSVKYTYDENGEPADIRYNAVNAVLAEEIRAKLGEYPGADVKGIGCNSVEYETQIPEDMISDKLRQLGYSFGEVILFTVDGGLYAELCEKAGAPVGSNILLNTLRVTSDNGRLSVFAPLKFSKQTLTLERAGGENIEITLDGELSGDDIPYDLTVMAQAPVMILVQQADANLYRWYTDIADSAGFAAHAKTVMKEHFGGRKGRPGYYYTISDRTTFKLQQKTIIGTMMFFAYGFVGMLALIALTSVVSTISTNIRSRAREFAMLQSVGMTPAGIKKMLDLESVISTGRSLLLGLPLGVLGAYFGVYRGMNLAAGIPFKMPWYALAECVIGVFAITWATMRFAARRVKDGNVIDAIRRGD